MTWNWDHLPAHSRNNNSHGYHLAPGHGTHLEIGQDCGTDSEREESKLKLKPTPPTDTRVLIPTSVVLQRLHDEAPADHFTLGWLMAACTGAPSASSCSCSPWSRSHRVSRSSPACSS